MPYLKLVKAPCICTLPSIDSKKNGRRKLDVGTVWECSECGQQHLLVKYGEELNWKKLDKADFLPSKKF